MEEPPTSAICLKPRLIFPLYTGYGLLELKMLESLSLSDPCSTLRTYVSAAQTWHARFGEFIHKRDDLCSSTAKASVHCSLLNVLSDAAYQWWCLVRGDIVISAKSFPIWNWVLKSHFLSEANSWSVRNFGLGYSTVFLFIVILLVFILKHVLYKSENCCREVPGIVIVVLVSVVAFIRFPKVCALRVGPFGRD